MSLWNVSDVSTALLMRRFYTNLVVGQTKAAALREAKLAMLSDSRHKHPFFWASLILIGEDGPVFSATELKPPARAEARESATEQPLN